VNTPFEEMWIESVSSVTCVEKLKNLFRGNRSRSEVVATFLSILELCKTGSVTLEGDISGENPDVRLIKNDNPEGGNINGSN